MKAHIGKFGRGTSPLCGATGFGGGISIAATAESISAEVPEHMCSRCVTAHGKREARKAANAARKAFCSDGATLEPWGLADFAEANAEDSECAAMLARIGSLRVGEEKCCGMVMVRRIS